MRLPGNGLMRTPSSTALLLFAVALPVANLFAQAPTAATNQTIFDQQILPVLTKNCAGCHSTANPSGGLTVASLETLLTGGKHGSAIIPGESKQSLVIQYLRGEQSRLVQLLKCVFGRCLLENEFF